MNPSQRGRREENLAGSGRHREAPRQSLGRPALVGAQWAGRQLLGAVGRPRRVQLVARARSAQNCGSWFRRE